MRCPCSCSQPSRCSAAAGASAPDTTGSVLPWQRRRGRGAVVISGVRITAVSCARPQRFGWHRACSRPVHAVIRGAHAAALARARADRRQLDRGARAARAQRSRAQARGHPAGLADRQAQRLRRSLRRARAARERAAREHARRARGLPRRGRRGVRGHQPRPRLRRPVRAGARHARRALDDRDRCRRPDRAAGVAGLVALARQRDAAAPARERADPARDAILARGRRRARLPGELGRVPRGPVHQRSAPGSASSATGAARRS